MLISEIHVFFRPRTMPAQPLCNLLCKALHENLAEYEVESRLSRSLTPQRQRQLRGHHCANGHQQDKNERDLGSSIVSVSLGLPAIFLWGGSEFFDVQLKRDYRKPYEARLPILLAKPRGVEVWRPCSRTSMTAAIEAGASLEAIECLAAQCWQMRHDPLQ